MTGSAGLIAPGATRLRRNSTLRLRTTAAVIVAALVATPTVSADRLPDDAVKALFERIDNERDRFEDQLDGKIKSSILDGAVHVENFLDDLQANVDRLHERFKSDYAANAEVTTVLRQGTDVQRFMSRQPPDLEGASEWNQLASSLADLAKVYGTTFPLPEGQQARRFNDREVEKVASELAESANQFKEDLESAFKTDTTLDQPTKDAALKEVEGLKEDAEELASRLGDGRPASGEAMAVIDRAARIRGAAASSGRARSPAAQATWGSVETGLQKLALAFDLPAPRP
jgi:polyhydroxyalkanoate synthesis regulator phasin